MKTRLLTALTSVILLAAAAAAAETFDDAVNRASADYAERLRRAADELNSTRKRITDEKAPLLKEMRSAEDRIVTAQSQIERLETGQEDSAEQRRKLLMDLDAVRKNTAYIATLAHDGLVAFEDGLAPGESQLLSDRLQALRQNLDDSSAAPSGQSAVDGAEFLLEQTRRELGGYSAPGSSLIAGKQPGLQGHVRICGARDLFPFGGGRPRRDGAAAGRLGLPRDLRAGRLETGGGLGILPGKDRGRSSQMPRAGRPCALRRQRDPSSSTSRRAGPWPMRSSAWGFWR